MTGDCYYCSAGIIWPLLMILKWEWIGITNEPSVKQIISDEKTGNKEEAGVLSLHGEDIILTNIICTLILSAGTSLIACLFLEVTQCTFVVFNNTVVTKIIYSNNQSVLIKYFILRSLQSWDKIIRCFSSVHYSVN